MPAAAVPCPLEFELQELNLTDNLLTTLPAELGKVTTLERLLLGSNRLQSLHPACTGHVSRADGRHLGGTHTGAHARTHDGDAGPVSAVESLVSLQTLELQDNTALEAMPASYASLIRLRFLNISNTAMPAIPYEVQYWTELTDLIAARNTQFEELPGTTRAQWMVGCGRGAVGGGAV